MSKEINVHHLELNWVNVTKSSGPTLNSCDTEELQQELNKIENNGREVISVIPLKYEQSYGGVLKLRFALAISIPQED
jgi:hypothetical protein